MTLLGIGASVLRRSRKTVNGTPVFDASDHAPIDKDSRPYAFIHPDCKGARSTFSIAGRQRPSLGPSKAPFVVLPLGITRGRSHDHQVPILPDKNLHLWESGRLKVSQRVTQSLLIPHRTGGSAAG